MWRNKKSGFTLVELLVSLGILGIIMGVGVANYRGYSRRQALLGAGRSLEANLRLAQEMATSGKKPDTACPALDGYRIVLTSVSYSIRADCSNNDSVSVGRDNIPLPTGVTMSAAISPGGPPVTEFVFKVLGMGTSLAANTSVIVNLTGLGSTQNVQVKVTAGGDISTALVNIVD